MKKIYGLVVALSFLFIFGSAWGQETTLSVCSYGGTYNEGYEKIMGKPFTDATGVKVIFTTFPTYAQMEAQVKSGNIEWDIVEAENRMYARGSRAGIFEPLDLTLIPTKDFVEGSVKKFGMGIVFYSYNVSYNSTKWPGGKGPKNMKDLWDVKKFSGPRTMKLTAESNLEAAILADGVPRDKVYPIDVDRALKKMTELKPNIRVFWKTGGQVQQIMREKEADAGLVPGGRMIQLADQGIPITMEWEDQLIVLDYLTFAEWVNYGPANRKAYDFIKNDKAVLMPTYPDNYKKGLLLDEDWYADHEESVEKLWEAWKMK
jgi:putative spermidine/putrescine transport system substrate-binding protein